MGLMQRPLVLVSRILITTMFDENTDIGWLF